MACWGKKSSGNKSQARTKTQAEIEEQDFVPETFDDLFTILDHPNKSVEDLESEKEEIRNQITRIKEEGNEQLLQEFTQLADDMISM